MYINIMYAEKNTLMYGTAPCMRLLSPAAAAPALIADMLHAGLWLSVFKELRHRLNINSIVY